MNVLIHKTPRLLLKVGDAGKALDLRTLSSLENVQQGIVHLRMARKHLIAAGARMSVDRVRMALKSAEGAERHQLRLEEQPPEAL